MATQFDSIDIANLKESILREEQGKILSEHEQDVSLASTATPNHTSKDLESRRTLSPRKYTTKVPLKDGTNHQSRRITRGSMNSEGHTSPSQLPTTIPDSLAGRMAATASQSEGDTQELSQGAKEEFASKIREHNAERQLEAAGDTASNWVLGSHSFQPGETGYIDIMAGLEQPFGTNTEEMVEGADDFMDQDSQSADVRAELFPESRRFRQPITPAPTSRKRQRIGSPASREVRTPGLPVNPFAGQTGGNDGLMNSSQAFQATQFISPPINGLTSDGLSQRPSPDVFQAPRPSTADPMSSPVRLPRSRMTRAVTEPQTTYISMQESQEERERQKKLSELAQARAGDRSSDEGFDSEDSEIRRRRIRRKIELDSREEFAAVTAKARPGPSRRGRGGRRPQTPRNRSNRNRRTSASDPVVISDSPIAEDNITEDETEKEEERIEESEVESPDELCEENKENFNLKTLQAPRMAPRAASRKTSQMFMPATTSHPPARRSVSPNMVSDKRSGMERNPSMASRNDFESTPTATATIAIADSQPACPSSRDNPQNRRDANEDDTEQLMFIPQSQIPASVNSSLLSKDARTIRSQDSSFVPASSTSPIVQRFGAKGEALKGPSCHNDGKASSNEGAGASITVSTVMPLESVHRNSSQKHLPIGNTAPISPSSKRTSGKAVDAMPISTFPVCKDSDMGLRYPSLQPSSRSKSITAVLDTSSVDQQAERPDTMFTSSALPMSSNTSTRLESRIQSSPPSSTPYDTAPAFPPIIPEKSGPSNLAGAQQPLSMPHPRSTNPKSMTEIATAASPPGVSNDVDVDVNIMTADDVEYQTVMRGSSPIGPARKRRRGRTGRVLHVDEPYSDDQSKSQPLPSSSQDGDGKGPNSVNPAKDQLRFPSATPLESEVLSKVVEGQFGPRQPSNAETPRKRGRPKKASISTAAPVEFDNPHPNNEQSSKKTSRAELSQIRTQHVAQGAENGSPSSVLLVAPNQVFAHFNGTCAAYYPATCIGVIAGQEPQYRVRFDDGTIDVINGFGIKRLELKPGDNVKLDLGGSRKKTYVVVRMHARQQPTLTPDPDTPTRRNRPEQINNSPSVPTDIRGYANVVVAPKRADNAEPQTDEVLTVPVRDVYFTQTMWTSFKDRAFTYTPGRSQHLSCTDTPLERSSIPSTPSSRSHRIQTSGVGPSSRSERLSATARSSLFDNMVFAITNIAEPSLRTNLKNLINNHGGQLLLEDFSELFSIPSLTPTTPTKRSPKRDTNTSLQLTAAASRKGFTCLIADKHCRMAKYIQALALGIPCLSSRWIQDSVAKQLILPWEPYLLAAGESSFLNGAVRSRILPSIDPLSTTLSEIVEARPKPLKYASVLLIMEKNEEETMRSHPLLSHALGASKVARATSLDSAAKMLAEAETNNEPWAWVYSHDKEDKAEKVLFGRGKGGSSGSSKKRKRESSALSRGDGSQTRIVGNEFVIQSLILGKLID